MVVGESMRRMQPWWKRAGALAALGLVLACGDNGTGPEVEGSFSATITGDLQRTLSGTAVFGVTTVQGVEGFALAFERGSAATFDVDLILLGRFNTQRPSVGTYDIVESGCDTCGEDDFDGGYVFQYPTGSSGIFVSDAGQLTITKSTADTVAGTCSFSAHDLTDASSTITLSASFTAVTGEIPGLPGG